MNRIRLALFLFLLVPGIDSRCQEYTPFEIGERVRIETTFKTYNHQPGNIRLADFRGKLLLIDFWATWCTSCIAAFPKLEKLQKAVGDSLQVLLATREEEQKVQAFFTKRRQPDGHPYQLTTIVGDSVLWRFFPHATVPHYVWISAEGKVLAITGAGAVNETTVRQLLRQEATLTLKKDLDHSRPLFLSEYFPENSELVHYSIFSRGVYEGLPSGSAFRRRGDTVIGRAYYNTPLLDMYSGIANFMFEKKGEPYNRKRLVVEGQDRVPSLAFTDSNDPESGNVLCNYDMVVSPHQADSLFDYMLSDLNRYTSCFGRIEKRRMKCLVLLRTSDIDRMATKGGKPQNTLFDKQPARLVNCPIAYLVMRLNEHPAMQLLVLDETGYTGKADLEFSPFDTIAALRSQLAPYDLDLIECVREIDVFVVSGKNL